MGSSTHHLLQTPRIRVSKRADPTSCCFATLSPRYVDLPETPRCPLSSAGQPDPRDFLFDCLHQEMAAASTSNKCVDLLHEFGWAHDMSPQIRPPLATVAAGI